MNGKMQQTPPPTPTRRGGRRRGRGGGRGPRRGQGQGQGPLLLLLVVRRPVEHTNTPRMLVFHRTWRAELQVGRRGALGRQTKEDRGNLAATQQQSIRAASKFAASDMASAGWLRSPSPMSGWMDIERAKGGRQGIRPYCESGLSPSDPAPAPASLSKPKLALVQAIETPPDWFVYQDNKRAQLYKKPRRARAGPSQNGAPPEGR
ncbi:hypothetical protein B0T26DRAFT_315153 [Lasiosphaeria miniovina]|uniref:Uncharacterized protein n=1 Tax=Lasiosphaeria miniovina TaxID=1954250 RepID=A0AA40E0G6_9PEZI|nr:uncharacterized protein B0T26DRAFT_315153 [Lasiosphaeria miniovina]KAK0718143.1 hypothetical protein B0T26DRAFT_315153 [Lasiosphaeria miniovina]